MAKPRYRRVLLKLSGEALAPAQGHGIDLDALGEIAKEVKEVAAPRHPARPGHRRRQYPARQRVRGARDGPLDRRSDGHAGDGHQRARAAKRARAVGVPTRVLSAIEMQAVCEPYILRRAVRHLEKGRVVFSPPAPAIPISPPIPPPACARWKSAPKSSSRRAITVDGVYDRDPLREPDAERFDRLTYIEVFSGISR